MFFFKDLSGKYHQRIRPRWVTMQRPFPSAASPVGRDCAQNIVYLQASSHLPIAFLILTTVLFLSLGLWLEALVTYGQLFST
jgi:hypothetical protein